jgi:hypothetical protein
MFFTLLKSLFIIFFCETYCLIELALFYIFNFKNPIIIRCDVCIYDKLLIILDIKISSILGKMFHNFKKSFVTG